MSNYANFSDLQGKVLTEIVGDKNSEVLYFTCSDGSKYEMYHCQDCCESVSIEDIDGDLQRLIGSPILLAEETSNSDNPSDYESCTWTYYKLSTVIDSVTIRWFGSSNGYYSEGVSFYITQQPTKTVEAKTMKIQTVEKEVKTIVKTRILELTEEEFVGLQDFLSRYDAKDLDYKAIKNPDALYKLFREIVGAK